MPPQRSIRNVTLEELFAERIDLAKLTDIKTRKVVLKMTCEFLMINGYIRFDRYRSADRYPRLFAFIFVSAASEKSRHNTQISECVHFLGEKRYDRDVKHAFKRIYEGCHKHFSFILISAFAMNICQHIRRNRIRLQMWYMRDAVILLSRMFCGNRFQMESSFDKLEELSAYYYKFSYQAVPEIIAQSEVSQTTYENEYVFFRSILLTHVMSPNLVCR